MPTPNSSSKDNTTKVFTREMYKTHSIPQMIELKKQGWVSPHPVTDWKEEWKQQADNQGFAYKASDFDPSKQLSPERGDTYIAGMQNQPDPKLAALRSDPEMKQIAASMGVSVEDLLLFREMMLDRFSNRYNLSPKAPPNE